MNQTAIDADLEAEFAAVAADSGCELVHVELNRGTLRVFLDRPEGVTLEDCAHVSRQLSALLDLHDFGKQRYLLEVSSPGLDRKLYRPRDYARFRGHLVRVTYFAPPDRAKRTVVGRLVESRVEDEAAGGGEITVVESDSNERLDIPLADVKVARLEIEL